MAKTFWKLTNLILFTITGSIVALPGLALTALNDSDNTQSLSQLSISQGNGSEIRHRVIDRVLQIAQEADGLGIRRGDVCAISPGKKSWSDRPLFLWQKPTLGLATPGGTKKIFVRDPETRLIVWEQAIDSATDHVLYAGATALQPGHHYDWQVTSDTPMDDGWIDFEVMGTAERNPIMAKLQQIKGATPEAIVLQKVQYFQSLNLRADALRVLYAVSNPSTAITQKIAEIESAFCIEN